MHYGTEAVDFVEGPDEFLAAVAGPVERLEASEVEAQDYPERGRDDRARASGALA